MDLVGRVLRAKWEYLGLCVFQGFKGRALPEWVVIGQKPSANVELLICYGIDMGCGLRVNLSNLQVVVV